MFLYLIAVQVNGLACKDSKLAQANDFFSGGFPLMGNTSNPLGSKVIPVTVAQVPGLNTPGISMVRIDIVPWGVNPPHTPPRASEILTVLEGSLQVGFVTSNPEKRLITKVIQKSDVFVFPVGLIHLQHNVGTSNAVAIAALNSQNPGVIGIANAMFGPKPDIPEDILVKAFQVDRCDFSTSGQVLEIHFICNYPLYRRTSSITKCFCVYANYYFICKTPSYLQATQRIKCGSTM